MENWLKLFAEDAAEWVETEELKMFPPMIANDYINFRKAASTGNVYKTILASRDLYETIIKIPVIMSLIILSHNYKSCDNPEMQQEIQGVLVGLLELPMSIGSWSALAREIGDKTRYSNIPQSLKVILKYSRKLFSQKISKEYPTIESWRNNVIGHGKIACRDDDSHREAIENMVRNVAGFITADPVSAAYSQIYFSQNGTLVRGNTGRFSETGKVWLTAEDIKYDASEYVLKMVPWKAEPARFDPLLFESYYSRKKRTKFLDYYSGTWEMNNNSYFRSLYDSLVFTDADLKRSERAVTQYEDELLRKITSVDHYYTPEKLKQKIKETADWLGKGIITVFMERGTGKTALADHMDSRYESKELFPEWVVRTYHLRDISLRSIKDFYSAVNIAFSITSGGQYVRLQDEVRISDSSNAPGKDMAALLNAYHDYYSNYEFKDCTILILDGLDELPYNAEKLLNHLPEENDLVEGCFVLLLSRFPDENSVDEKSRLLINRIKDLSSECIEIRRSAPENTDILKKYVQSRIHTDLASEELIKNADYRFLKLKLYSAVDSLPDLMNKSETEIISQYFLSLINGRSQKIRNEAVRLASAIAILKSISLRQYADVFNNGDLDYPLIGILNDFQPLVTEIRIKGETYYSFANIEYERFIQKTYQSACQELIEELICQFSQAAETDLIELESFWLKAIDTLFDLSATYDVSEYCRNKKFLDQLQLLLISHSFGKGFSEIETERLRMTGWRLFIRLIADYSTLDCCEEIKLKQIARSTIISIYPEDYLQTINKIVQPICTGKSASLNWLEYLIYPDPVDDSALLNDSVVIKKKEAEIIVSAYEKGGYLDILIDFLCYKVGTGVYDSYLKEISSRPLSELQQQKVWSALVTSHIHTTFLNRVEIDRLDIVDKYYHLLNKTGKNIITLKSDTETFTPGRLTITPYSVCNADEIERQISGGRAVEQIKRWDAELTNNKAIMPSGTDGLFDDPGKDGRVVSAVKNALSFRVPSIDEVVNTFLNHYYNVLEYCRLNTESPNKEEYYLLRNSAGFFTYMLSLKAPPGTEEFYDELSAWLDYLYSQKNNMDYQSLLYPMFRLCLEHADTASARYLTLLDKYIHLYCLSKADGKSDSREQCTGLYCNTIVLHYLQTLITNNYRAEAIKLIEEVDAGGTVLADDDVDPEHLISNAGNSVCFIRLKETAGINGTNALSYLNYITDNFKKVIFETDIQSKNWQLGERRIDMLIDAFFRIYYENSFWLDGANEADRIEADFEMRLMKCHDEKERDLLFVYKEKMRQIAFFFRYLIDRNIKMPAFEYSMEHVYHLYFLDAVMLAIEEIKKNGLISNIEDLLPDRFSEVKLEKQYWELQQIG